MAQQRWILPHDPRLVVLDRADLDLFRFLEQLPKDALVAGHPWDMDNVPLMARRSVVANGEISHPYYMGFYAYIRPRIADTLRAYYAKDWSEVEAFARQYNVSALVVRRDRFPPPERSRLFFEPYESEVRAWLGERKQFALADPPASELCYENSRYRVLCFDERNPAQGLGPGPHP